MDSVVFLKLKREWPYNYPRIETPHAENYGSKGTLERDRPLIRPVSLPCPSESSSCLTKNGPRENRAVGDPGVISIRSLQSGIISQEAGVRCWPSRSLWHSCPFASSSTARSSCGDRYTHAGENRTRSTIEASADNEIVPDAGFSSPESTLQDDFVRRKDVSGRRSRRT